MHDLQRLSVPSLACEVLFSTVNISEKKNLSHSLNPIVVFLPKSSAGKSLEYYRSWCYNTEQKFRKTVLIFPIYISKDRKQSDFLETF